MPLLALTALAFVPAALGQDIFTKSEGGASCPMSTMITDVDECRRAGEFIGQIFRKSVTTDNNRPGGCFWDQNGDTYFNTNFQPDCCTWAGTGGLCKELALSAHQDNDDLVCILQNTDYLGADINGCGLTGINSAEECQSHCQSNDQCTHFTFISQAFTRAPSRQGQCCLKNGMGEFRNDEPFATGLESGPRECPCAQSLRPFQSNTLNGVILFGGWRTEAQLESMSEDDKRNTVIVELDGITSYSVSELQGKDSTGSLGSLVGIAELAIFLRDLCFRTTVALSSMTYDDIRNTLIVELESASDYSIADLQAKNDAELAALAAITFVVVQPASPLSCETLDCSSHGYAYATCAHLLPVDNMQATVELTNKYSSSACELETSFGISDERTSMWVDGGCRGEFRICIFEATVLQNTEIITIGGNDEGAPCVFPFIGYQTVYRTCTAENTDEGDEYLWCGTTADYDTDGKWGKCPGCIGGDSCCEDGNCGVNEGDCDDDDDCQNGLQCGTNNCVGKYFERGDDCCYAVPDSCDPDPCLNEGTCSGGVCTCPTGFVGDQCQSAVSDIITTDGACVFPFKGYNTIYNGCTSEHSDTGSNPGYNWCATTYNYDADGEWGKCPGCIGGDSCCEDGNCGIGDGDCDDDDDCASGLTCGYNNCVGDYFDATDDCCEIDPACVPSNCSFPFTLRGQQFSTCTRELIPSSRFWCATTSGFDHANLPNANFQYCEC